MAIVKGKRAVYEALKSSNKIERLLILSQHKKRSDISPLIQLAQKKGIKIEWSTNEELDQLVNDRHQGIVAFVKLSDTVSLPHLLDAPNDYPAIVILDHIQDPYNFGSILDKR